MKKRVLFILLFIFGVLLINANLVSASYNITYKCQDNVCIKGQTAEWLIEIYNEGSSTVEYTAVELRNSADDSIIAILDIPYEPLKDDRGELIVIRAYSKANTTLMDTLPSPNGENMLTYHLCFTKTVPGDAHTYRNQGIYELRHCYNMNETMPLFECIKNEYCDDDSYCVNNKCIKLDCSECQYIEKHKCIDYKCCSNDDCNLNETCIGNSCEVLDCNAIKEQANETGKSGEEEIDAGDMEDNKATQPDQRLYVVNHACSSEPCAQDEIIADYACVKANCNEDEFISKYACAKLNCGFDESILNHICQKLKCKEGEGIIDHACTPLECADDEAIINYACTKLDCIFFQKAESHSCLINTNLIIESVFLIIIVFLLVLDIKKYNGKHRKNLISMLLKKAKGRKK